MATLTGEAPQLKKYRYNSTFAAGKMANLSFKMPPDLKEQLQNVPDWQWKMRFAALAVVRGEFDREEGIDWKVEFLKEFFQAEEDNK